MSAVPARLFGVILCLGALAPLPHPVFGSQSAPLVSDALMEESVRLRDLALESDAAFDLLEDLTTEVGPRLAGTEQELRAIDWAVARLTAMGFDRVYTEAFPLTVWRRVSEQATLIGAYPQSFEITALGGSVSTPDGGVEGDVVRFETLADLEAVPAGSLTGKIVYIANRMERFRDGRGYGPAVRARADGASVAAARGASAVMIRSIGTDSHRLPHTGQMRYSTDAPKIAAVALSNPDADQIDRLIARGPVRLHLEVETSSMPGESRNVIAEITGSDLAEDVVIVGGHLDSWDLGTGAVDDGAGVALTAAAAYFIQNESIIKPRRTIRVIWFGAEEQGLTGARAYAAGHAEEIERFVAGAESDFGAGKVWGLAAKTGSGALPATDALMRLLGPLGVVRAPGLASGGPDIGRLAALGMPVYDLKQDGQDYFDLHHTADDTLDKVDPEALRQNLAAWVSFLMITANWPGDFRGD